MKNFQQVRNIINKKLFKKCNFSKNNKYKICYNKACKNCYKKTLQSHPKCMYYNFESENKYDDILNHPRFIFRKSKRVYEFKCNCNELYFNTLEDIIFRNKWCIGCIKNNRMNKAIKYYEQFTFKFIYNELIVIDKNLTKIV